MNGSPHCLTYDRRAFALQKANMPKRRPLILKSASLPCLADRQMATRAGTFGTEALPGEMQPLPRHGLRLGRECERVCAHPGCIFLAGSWQNNRLSVLV